MHPSIKRWVLYADAYDEAYTLQLAYQAFDAECNEATFAAALWAEDMFFSFCQSVLDADVASTTPA